MIGKLHGKLGQCKVALKARIKGLLPGNAKNICNSCPAATVGLDLLQKSGPHYQFMTCKLHAMQ